MNYMGQKDMKTLMESGASADSVRLYFILTLNNLDYKGKKHHVTAGV